MRALIDVQIEAWRTRLSLITDPQGCWGLIKELHGAVIALRSVGEERHVEAVEQLIDEASERANELIRGMSGERHGNRD